MKQKLRQIFKISLLTASVFVLSCNDDDQVNDQTHNHKSLVVKEISFEDLLRQDTFLKPMEKLQKKCKKRVL